MTCPHNATATVILSSSDWPSRYLCPRCAAEAVAGGRAARSGAALGVGQKDYQAPPCEGTAP